MKKIKLLKRALAVVLTMTMALGVVPMTAFAAETSQAAQEAAAMQALESRVFTVGEEQLTIEDLEQSTFVMVTTAEGKNLTVPGNEIREYMLENIDPRIAGSITVSPDYNSQTGIGRVKIYATGSGIYRIQANNVQWRNSPNSVYKTIYQGTFIREFISTSSAIAYSPTVSCSASEGISRWIYYDKITVYANGGNFYAENRPYNP